MRAFFIVAIVLFFTACQKENVPPSVSRTDFFANETEANHTLQNIINQKFPGEKLLKIESISYIDSKNKSYAVVLYRTRQRESSVVLQQPYLNGQKLAMTSITCSGSSCDCKVSTIISNSGVVTVSCSCSSCTMLVNTIAAP